MNIFSDFPALQLHKHVRVFFLVLPCEAFLLTPEHAFLVHASDLSQYTRARFSRYIHARLLRHERACFPMHERACFPVHEHVFFPVHPCASFPVYERASFSVHKRASFPVQARVQKGDDASKPPVYDFKSNGRRNTRAYELVDDKKEMGQRVGGEDGMEDGESMVNAETTCNGW